MSRSKYVDLDEDKSLQTNIMLFVEWWAKTKKTPVPQKEIINVMKERGIKDYTVVWALNALLRKKFIRRSGEISNKTAYVQLRSVSI